jgi:hypothetical protein
LRAHLAEVAEGTTLDQLEPGRQLRTSVNVWNIADLINGSTRCTGTGGPSDMSSVLPDIGGQIGRNSTSNNLSCSSQMPTNAQRFMGAVMARRLELFREGRYGTVQTIDVPTDDSADD